MPHSRCRRAVQKFTIVVLTTIALLAIGLLRWGRTGISVSGQVPPCNEFCGNSVIECTGNCDDGMQCSNGASCTSMSQCNGIGDGFCIARSGDGCNSECAVENGYTCIGEPSVCTPIACGNGSTESGEQCDDGNTRNGDCCSSSCQFESSSTVCRTSAGVCDSAETCTGSSGSCPADAKHTASTVCRASTATCDPAETCTGSSDGCPADTNTCSVTIVPNKGPTTQITPASSARTSSSSVCGGSWFWTLLGWKSGCASSSSSPATCTFVKKQSGGFWSCPSSSGIRSGFCCKNGAYLDEHGATVAAATPVTFDDCRKNDATTAHVILFYKAPTHCPHPGAAESSSSAGGQR